MTDTQTPTESTPATERHEPHTTRSSPIVAALESTWAAIQALHPEVPDVVIVLASGSIGMPRGVLRLGHFAAMRWHSTRAGARLPEVFIGGEGLARGGVDVLGTLLHEAAHGLAHVRGIQDCSRQGRYHNRRFQTLAAELGLHVRQVPVIGWSDTHVPAETAAGYAEQIDQLAAALTIHRYAEGDPSPTTGGANDGDDQDDDTETDSPARPSNTCRCACPRRITVAPSILALGAITCSICGEAFAPT